MTRAWLRLVRNWRDLINSRSAERQNHDGTNEPRNSNLYDSQAIDKLSLLMMLDPIASVLHAASLGSARQTSQPPHS
jgi:hypothetical protein